MTDSITFNQMLINFIDFQGRYAATLWASSKKPRLSRVIKHKWRDESTVIRRITAQLCRAFGIDEREWMGIGWVELIQSIPSEEFLDEDDYL